MLKSLDKVVVWDFSKCVWVIQSKIWHKCYIWSNLYYFIRSISPFLSFFLHIKSLLYIQAMWNLTTENSICIYKSQTLGVNNISLRFTIILYCQDKDFYILKLRCFFILLSTIPCIFLYRLILLFLRFI